MTDIKDINSKNTKGKHYIIGYIGSDRLSYGRKLAEELGCPFIVTDEEIERLDGRSIFRTVMIHGEHSYRNMEYELLEKLNNPEYDHGLAKDEKYPETLVVVCGDGIILDDMCFEILENGNTYFVDEAPEVLWDRVKDNTNIPYFFMASSDEAAKKKSFMDFYQLRLPLYRQAVGCPSKQK